MDNFDPKIYKRNPNKINQYLKRVDDSIVTNKKLYIMFPEKFVDKGISTIGSLSYIIGVFAILDDDGNYSVSLIPTRMSVSASEIETVLIDDVPYIILHIDEGMTLINSTKLVMDNSTAYSMFDLFYIQGKIPWFIEYEDLPILFNNLFTYAGSKAGKNILAYEILTAIVARIPNDPLKEYRLLLKTLEDIKKITPLYVGLSDIWYAFKSTLAKVAGSYMKLGIVSSINYPEKEISDLEHIIRE